MISCSEREFSFSLALFRLALEVSFALWRLHCSSFWRSLTKSMRFLWSATKSKKLSVSSQKVMFAHLQAFLEVFATALTTSEVWHALANEVRLDMKTLRASKTAGILQKWHKTNRHETSKRWYRRHDTRWWRAEKKKWWCDCLLRKDEENSQKMNE